MKIEYYIFSVIFNVNLAISSIHLSLMVTTFNEVIVILFVGYCFSALDCVDLMSWRSIRCDSKKLRRMSFDSVLRFFAALSKLYSAHW